MRHFGEQRIWSDKCNCLTDVRVGLNGHKFDQRTLLERFLMVNERPKSVQKGKSVLFNAFHLRLFGAVPSAPFPAFSGFWTCQRRCPLVDTL